MISYNLKLDNRIKEIIYCLLSGTLALVCTLIIYRVWNMDLSIPIGGYESDIIGAEVCARDIINGDWLYYSHATYPYDTAYISGAVGHTFHAVIFKIISLFCKDAIVLVNIYYLLGFFLMGCIAYIALRQVGTATVGSIICAVLYSQLPYHYLRNEIHIYLSAYYLVPLACVVIYNIFSGRYFLNTPDNAQVSFKNLDVKRLMGGCLICVLLGISDIYYSALFAIVCGAVSLAVFAKKKNFRYFLVGLFYVVVIAFVLAMVMLPSKIYGIYNGISGYGMNRYAFEAELYGLKWIYLILPIQGHRISFLSNLRNAFDTELFYNNENTLVSLGLFLSIGLLISIFSIASGKNSSDNGKGEVVRNTGIINLVMILCGTVGGIGSVVAVMLTTSIRCYNRICVFIAFFAAVTLAILIDELYRRLNKRISKYICRFAMCLLLGVGIWEMTTDEYAYNRGVYFNGFTWSSNVDEVTEAINNDKEFVKNIQAVMPENSNILQLPVVTNDLFPNGNPKVWRHQWKQIFSTGIKWSHGDNSFGRTYQWLQRIKNLPADKLLEAAVSVGFNGIYIDTIGYDGEQAEKIIREIEEITDAQPIVNPEGDIYFFNITDYAQKVLSFYSEDEAQNLKAFWLDTFYGYYDKNRLGFTQEVEVDADGNCIMSDGVLQYGPYITLETGDYRITYKGDKLRSAEFSCRYNEGRENIPITIIENTDDCVIYTIHIEETIENIEFYCNAHADGVAIGDIYVEDNVGEKGVK